MSTLPSSRNTNLLTYAIYRTEVKQTRPKQSRAVVGTLVLLLAVLVGLSGVIGGVSVSPLIARAASGSTLYGWGSNHYGQLGNNSTTDSSNPVVVSFPVGVTPTAFAAGQSHSLAIGSDGQLYAWGNNQYGQLGNNSTTNSSSPVTITLYPGVHATAIAAGSNHSLAIGSDGKVYAWGLNDHGQLGNNSTTNSSVPISLTLPMPGGATPLAIAAGQSHSMATDSLNHLYTWGYNSDGELGDNSTTDRWTPVTPGLYPGVYAAAIAAGQFHSMAIGTDGKLYTWGYNQYGQLGDGTTTSSKIAKKLTLPGGVLPTAIAGGYYHSLAIGNDGKLYAWGINSSGQLGNGTTSGTNANSTPLLVNLPAGVTPTTIAAGYYHSLATGNDGKLYAWGYNNFGQLGNGTTSDSSSPVAIGTAGGGSLAAGQYHTLGLLSVPGQIAASSGSGQSAAVGTAFGAPLVAIVKDSSSNPVSSVVVTFTAPGSGATGSFSGGSSVYTGTTNASGIVTATTFTANTTAGSYNVTASVGGVSIPATFVLTNTAGSVNSISIVSGNNQSATVGTNFTNLMVARVTDKYGNPISGTGVTFTAPRNGASLGFGGTSQTTMIATTASNGQGSSLNFTANSVAGRYTVTASADQVGGPTVLTTFTLTNTVGPANRVSIVSGSNQSTLINTAFAAKLVAKVTDSYGNPVSSTQVTFTPPTSGASAFFTDGPIMPTYSGMTDASGTITTATVNANAFVGSYGVTATVSGVSTPAVFALTNTTGAPANLSIVSGDGQSATVNTAFNSSLVVSVTDQFGNAVSGVAVTFTAPASGASGSFTGGSATYTGTTDASGLVTATTFTANTVTGSYNLIASASGGSLSTSFSLTNTAGSAANLSIVSGDRQNTMVNAAFNDPLVVRVTDQYGNPVAGANVTFTAPASGASLIFAGTSPTTTIASTDANGQANTPKPTANSVAGSYTVTASVSGVPNSVNFSLTNIAGVPVSISVVSGSGQSALINQPFNNRLVAKLVDSNNNGVAGVAVTFTAPNSGASGTFANGNRSYIGRTDNNGVITATLFTANSITGVYTVTATVNGVNNPANFTLSNDILYAWGANFNGQLGNSTTTNSSNPLLAGLPGGVVPTAIAGGFAHSLAIGNDGNLYAWGSNQFGQLGNGTTTDSATPVLVNFPAGVVPTAISLGFYHSLALGNDGALYGWGFNGDGELGNGTAATANPVPVMIHLPGNVTPIAISAGTYHNLAIGNNGNLYAWGNNQYGQLGNGTTTSSATPVVVNLPAGVVPVAIAAAYYHSLAIGSDGKLYAWGYNAEGQLGNGTTTNSSTPVVVNLPAGVTPIAITKGYYHSLAIGSDGNLYAWGNNNAGALGSGNTTNSSTPVVVNLPAGVTPTAIATGLQDSLAIGSDGLVYAWGDNSSGQLGNGTTTSSSIPVVVNLPAGVTPSAIAAGSAHNLAIFGLPYLNINSIAKAEGNSGTTPFTFTVTLSAASNQTVTVNYATADGTATAPADYTATSGTLTFAPGITTATVTVPVKGDTQSEPDETFVVTLSSPTNALIGTTSGLGAILNDDACQALVVTAITDDGTGTSCGTLSYALAQPVSGSSGVTITFALTRSNTITFTGSLTTTAKVKAGVTIYGGAFGSSSRIILNGNGVSGNGLDLLGRDTLVNLTIKGFKGKQLILESTGNRLQGVAVGGS